MEPFKISVPEEQVAALRRRVRASRLLPALVGDAWRSGVNYAELARLAAY